VDLQTVGFWRNDWDEETAALPDPRELVDASWPLRERVRVAIYLRGGERAAAWLGYSTCRFCCGTPDRFMGDSDLRDDAWVWPEGFAHYVEFHAVKPPEAFLAHVAPRLPPLFPVLWRLGAWFRRARFHLRIAVARIAAEMERRRRGPETTPLLSAAEEGDLAGVEAALKDRDVDERDDLGGAALHRAVRGDHVEVVRLLLERGADANARTKIDETPLVLVRSVEVATLLLDAGAEIDPTPTCNTTPLRAAAGRGDLPLVELLLARGAAVNAADAFGRTPLMSSYREAVAALLLARGADVRAVASGGFTALHLAARGAEAAAVARLLLAAGAFPDAVDDDGETPLMRAANTVDGEEAVQVLLEAGADAAVVSRRGVTALMYAALRASVANVERLLAAGAPVERVCSEKRNALHWAALAKDNREQKPAVLERLLAAGADPDQRDQWGRTPLDCCVEYGLEAEAEVLRSASPS